MIPYSRPKRCDLYTLSYSKLLENHTLHSGTYLYSPYMAVPPPPPPTRGDHQNINYTLIFYGCTIRLTNYCIASIRKTLRALLLIQLLLATWFAIASTATTIQIPAILFCHLSFTADRHQQGHIA